MIKTLNNVINNYLTSCSESPATKSIFKIYFKNNSIINILKKNNINESIIDEIEMN